MPTINQLPVRDVSGSDQLPAYSADNGDVGRWSINALMEFFRSNLQSPATEVITRVPASGETITLPTPAATMQWLVLQPAATLTALTITFPLASTVIDGTEILITTTQSVTTTTVGLNGATAVTSLPTATLATILAANNFVHWKFVKSANTWYRVG